MHPLLKLQNTSVVFDYSSDLGIRSCIGSMDSSFLQIGKPIPVYRATYYCGQKCTWPPEEEWKAMKDQEAKRKKQAKFDKGRPTKVEFPAKYHMEIFILIFNSGISGLKKVWERQKSH
jgi:hypothetical protein